jgi:flavin-dependent dehydrogenase
MAHRAQDKGTEYVLNSSVKDIEVGKERVRVGATCQGERLNFEARAVVIASGFGSRLAAELGLGKVSYFLMGAQAEVETNGIDEVEVYFGQEVAPGFFAWLVPTSPHRALVGLALRRSAGSYLRKLMSSLLAQGKIASAKVKLYFRGIPLKSLPRTCSKRLIVVGDAAGQVKPTTGGGIYYGLLCADIAASTLHRALESDDLSAKSMANYEREWKVKLGRELRIDYWARKFYERLSNRQIDRIFDTIKSNGIAETLLKMEDLSFDWHGEVLLRVLKHKAMSKVVEAMRIPFPSRRGEC